MNEEDGGTEESTADELDKWLGYSRFSYKGLVAAVAGGIMCTIYGVVFDMGNRFDGAGKIATQAFGATGLVVLLGGVLAFLVALHGLTRFNARFAKETFEEVTSKEGQRFSFPESGATLPFTLHADPRVLRAEATKNPAVIFGAVTSLAGVSYGLAVDTGWPFLLVFATIFGLVAVLIAGIYLANRRGKIVLTHSHIHYRRHVRTKKYARDEISRAVRATMEQYVPRASRPVLTARLHFLRQSGRQAFQIEQDVWPEEDRRALLGIMQLPLYELPDSYDPVDLEAMMPGSTSLMLRRPYTVAFAIVGLLFLLLFVGIIVWTSLEGRDRGPVPPPEPRLEQSLTVNGVEGSIYGSFEEIGLPEDEGRALLFSSDIMDAHPRRGCLVSEFVDPDNLDCLSDGTGRFTSRLKSFDKASQSTPLGRSRARDSHHITLTEIRSVGNGHVVTMSVVDDGRPAYGVEVTLVNKFGDCPQAYIPAIDDIKCAGRPETSVYASSTYLPCQ